MFSKIKHFRLEFLLGVTAAVFLCASCTTEPPAKYMKKSKVHGDSSHRKFSKIQGYHIQLRLVSTRRSFHPGYDAELRYKLTNVGNKPLRIDEWFMNDPDNLQIYYRKWEKDLKKFVASEWTHVVPELKKPVRRFELVLNPGNSTFISKNLAFVKHLPPDKVPPYNKYFIIAKLNLTSIQAHSKADIIELKEKNIYQQGTKI